LRSNARESEKSCSITGKLGAQTDGLAQKHFNEKAQIQIESYSHSMSGVCAQKGDPADAITRRCALVIAALSSFLPPFMAASINIALPAIGAEFSMDAVLLGWIATSYLLAAAVFLIPFGRLADIHGMKKIFVIGLAVYTIASLLSAVAPSANVLIAVRIIQGVGSAMLFSTGTAILICLFPPHERGKVLGINVAFVYLGLSLGPVLGGFLTQSFGWRSIFLVNVLLGLIVLALVLWKLKGEWAAATGEKFDLIGSAIYSMMLICVMCGFSLLPEAVGWILFFLGLVSLIALIKWESMTDSPVLDIDLFRTNRVFAFSNLAALINYSATFAVGFLLSLYLQYIKGLSPQEAGAILIAQPLVMAIFSPIAGRLSDRIEPRIIASAGMALTLLGIIPFIFLDFQTSISYILGVLVILGLGLALFSSPNTNAIMSSIQRRSYGVGSATLASMRLVGQALSMGVAMLVFAYYIGRVEIMPENYSLFLQSTQTAFIIFSALCFLGIFASLARGEVRGHEKN
jgi:EmrB/QacA subfamily drug resistance transporter